MLAFELNKKAAYKSEGKKLFASMGFENGLFNKYPQAMSGGEQQQVAIAHVIASGAPHRTTGNINNVNSDNIIRLLKDFAHKNGKCVIVVTHSK